jgi:hypothetical protein
MLEPADIAGISKIAYVLATRRCFDWRRDLQRASTNSSPPCPIDHPRRRLRLHGMSQTLQRQLGTTTRYGRRCALLVAVVALLLAATAFAAPRHLLNGADRSSPLDDKGRSSLLDDKDRAPLSTDGWRASRTGGVCARQRPAGGEPAPSSRSRSPAWQR